MDRCCWCCYGVTSQGTTGQHLAKATDADYDVEWVDDTSTTLDFGIGLELTGTTVDLQPATDIELGGIFEPTPDDVALYVRKYTLAGVATWEPIPPGTTLTFGIGLTLTGDEVNLDIANTNGEIGGVMTVPRAIDQGLDMAVDGTITVPLATDQLAGSIVEPPPDAKGYVRTTQLNGVSQWVPPAPATGTDFGIGLSLDDTTDPPIVHLTPAGDGPPTLGGVYVIDRVRNNTEGLELGIDGRLRAPLATDSLAGTILEPPPDDKGYVRRRDLSGVSQWVPPATSEPAGNRVEEIGVVYIPDDRGLDIGPDGSLTLLIASDNRVGGMFDAPVGLGADADKTYVRKFGQWVENEPSEFDEPPMSPVAIWGRSSGGARGWLPIPEAILDSMEEPPMSPVGLWGRSSGGARGWLMIDQTGVVVAGDGPDQKGIVYVPDAMGIALGQDGRITLAPTTPSQIGGIVDAPFSDPTNPIGYVRQNAAWVESKADEVYIAGDVPDRVGVVYVPDAMGIALGADGRLTLAPTTPSQIGGIIDAPFSDPTDLKSYARQNAKWVEITPDTTDPNRYVNIDGDTMKGALMSYDIAPKDPLEFANKAYVDSRKAIVSRDTAPINPEVDQLWWNSNTGNTFIWFDDGDSQQWVQLAPGAGGGSSSTSGVEEAPIDAALYGRKDGAWEVIPPDTVGLADAPNNTNLYARKGGVWSIVPAAGISQATADARYLRLTGGTITGSLIVSGGATSRFELRSNASNYAVIIHTDVAAGNKSFWADAYGHYDKVFSYYNDAGAEVRYMKVIRPSGMVNFYTAVDFAVTPTFKGAPMVAKEDLDKANNRINQLERRLAALEGRMGRR